MRRRAPPLRVMPRILCETPSEQVIRDIRRATRKHYSAEDKIRIVLDGLRGEYSIAELCRREGIAESLRCTDRRDQAPLASLMQFSPPFAYAEVSNLLEPSPLSGRRIAPNTRCGFCSGNSATAKGARPD